MREVREVQIETGADDHFTRFLFLIQWILTTLLIVLILLNMYQAFLVLNAIPEEEKQENIQERCCFAMEQVEKIVIQIPEDGMDSPVHTHVEVDGKRLPIQRLELEYLPDGMGFARFTISLHRVTIKTIKIA